MKQKRLVIVALGFFILAQAAQAQWSTPKRITWTELDSLYPTVARDSKNTIHVVWQDPVSGFHEIYYKNSTDGGSTWTPAKRLTWTAGHSEGPVLAIDSNDVIHVIWSDFTATSNYEIYYKRSADGGATWSYSKRLTWTPLSSGLPAIAIDPGDTIHIVWTDIVQGHDEIYYKNSSDGGATWTAAKRLTWTSSYALFPDVATDSDKNIHVVWYHASQSSGGSPEIYYRKSADRGATWSAVKRLTWTSGYSFNPVIAIDSNKNIHVVWYDKTPGMPEIYYKKSSDGGTTWTAAKRLTWTPGWSEYPAIAIDSKNIIHVVWNDHTPGNPEIYYAKSTDGGVNWTAAERLTWLSAESRSPSVVVDANNTVHVVWWCALPHLHAEIYYMNGK
jgi:hypothetical protein